MEKSLQIRVIEQPWKGVKQGLKILWPLLDANCIEHLAEYYLDQVLTLEIVY